MTSDPWTISEDRYLPNRAGWREAQFTIGNGYLSTRGAFEEQRAGEVRCTFINGLFVTPPGELPLLGAVPDWTDFTITVDGEPLDLDVRPPAGYRRVLDMKRGELSRVVVWRGEQTGVVRVSWRRLVSMADPSLAALEVTIEALTDDVSVEVATGLRADVGSPTVPAFAPVSVQRSGAARFHAAYLSVDREHRLDAQCSIVGLPDAKFIDDELHPRFVGGLMVAGGSSVTLTKYVSYHADRDMHPEPSVPSEGTSYDEVLEESAAAWAQRWATSHVSVGGDPHAEQILHYAAFQVLAAASPSDPGSGMGARFMSGFGYRHHVFWDTDIFIAPYLTVTHPDLARVHMEYRYRGLPGARRKASKYGRRGAFYAWESAGTGDEVTPEWSTPLSGDPIRIWTGEIQEHINADVAWSIDHHWRWTGDDDFLASRGAEVIIDGAIYWADRLERESDGLHLRDVIGPDEYHIHVDDNFYTNLFAAWQLRRASGVARWLEARDPEGARHLFSRLGVTRDEIGLFEALADEVVLLSDDAGVWEQHEGFFGLDVVDLADFEPRIKSMYDLLGEERMQRTAILKQADVLMAMALLPDEADTGRLAAQNWAFYEPKADHGSSLSLSFHALLASRMGDPSVAHELFLRAAAIDLEDSMGNGADGIHAACQGGLLQTALFGFAGLSLGDDGPVTEPRLPDGWESMGFAYVHEGRVHEVEVSR